MADGPRKECQFKSLKEEVRNEKKDKEEKKHLGLSHVVCCLFY